MTLAETLGRPKGGSMVYDRYSANTGSSGPLCGEIMSIQYI